MEINRAWAMPSKNTFTIKPVKELIERYVKDCKGVIIDPFANTSKIANITNDLNPDYDTTYHMDATEFLEMLEDNSVDIALWDPPFSPRQVSECYKAFGMTVNSETTQASYWSKQKEQFSRIVKPGGIVISCGWNSGGVGSNYGFEIEEILLVAHGGWHNDTIITVSRKVK